MIFCISKSDYTLFMNCPKSLWLKFHKPELSKPRTEFEQLKIDEGHLVGKIAQTHPEYSENSILINTLNSNAALELTKSALANPEIKNIFEAAFSVVINEVPTIIRCDIVQKTNDKELSIVEVKSSTKLKDKYLQDIAFQKVVLEACGFKVTNAHIMLVNKEYTLGQEIDPKTYFYKENVIDLVAKMEALVPENLSQIKNILKIKEGVEYPQGSHCHQSFSCSFLATCGQAKNLDSIDNLRNLHYKKKEIFNELKITKLSQVTNDVLFNLTETQQLQVLCARKPETLHFEHSKIKSFISNLVYPFHFLDFESLLTAIPYYKGMKPHTFITYQASIHLREKQNTKLVHSNFLEKEKVNPHLGLISFLKKSIKPTGSIIVYHKQFEQARLEDLKKEFPSDAPLIDSWISRLWDLEVIFRSFWIYTHEQEGSTSLKKVLPTIVKSLTYKNLAIQNGNDSITQYLNLLETQDENTKKIIIKKLSDYNDLDTFCMVKILDKLKWLCTKLKPQIEINKIPA